MTKIIVIMAIHFRFRHILRFSSKFMNNHEYACLKFIPRFWLVERHWRRNIYRNCIKGFDWGQIQRERAAQKNEHKEMTSLWVISLTHYQQKNDVHEMEWRNIIRDDVLKWSDQYQNESGSSFVVILKSVLMWTPYKKPQTFYRCDRIWFWAFWYLILVWF